MHDNPRALRAGVLLLIFSLVASPAAAALPVVRVAIVTDGPWDYNQEVLANVQKEVGVLTEGEFDVRYPPRIQLQGDWTVASVRAALDQVLTDPTVDLVIAAGVLGSGDVGQRGPLPKPVIAPDRKSVV